ncbi:MAG: hypothetical protein HFH40_09820 [Lachnospiraceae bacterium]|jgi:hypothetical protein|nr:hypothetical protein [Lachnospiraceae bacterium]
MGKYAKHLAAVGFLVLAMVLLYLSAAAWGSLALGKVMFHLESPISISEGVEVMDRAEEDSEDAEEGRQLLPAFCIWGQKEGIAVENKNLSRTSTADAILLCGEPGLVFEGCQLPIWGDGQGCIISEDTAWELFGSSQVVGKEVSCRGTSYVVRQVLPIQGNMIAFQLGQRSAAAGERQGDPSGSPSRQSGSSFGQGNQVYSGGSSGQGSQVWAEEQLDRITLKSEEGISKRTLEGTLGMQYGLSVQLLDIELLGGISGACMLFAPVTICVFFAALICRQYKKQKTRPGKAWMAGALILLAAVTFLFLKGQIRISEDYIPSRWSDFSFWSSLWQEKADAVKFLVGMEKTELDNRWAYGFLKAAGCGLLAEILLLAGLVKSRNFNTNP